MPRSQSATAAQQPGLARPSAAYADGGSTMLLTNDRKDERKAKVWVKPVGHLYSGWRPVMCLGGVN